MKIIWLFFGMVLFLDGQIVVPKEGWRLVEKGGEKVEGMQFLGAWQMLDESLSVRGAWVEELPSFKVLVGLTDLKGVESVGIDSSFLPKRADVLKAPKLGLKIKLRDLGPEEMNQERFWIWGENGGVMLAATFKKGGAFALDEWVLQKSPKDLDGEKRKTLQALADYINGHVNLPVIKINDELRPPVAGGSNLDEEASKIRVEIRGEGKYFFEEKEYSLEELEGVFQKAKKGGDVTVLQISSEKQVAFKFTQRLIKAAARAGINQMAYGGIQEKVK